MAKTFSVAQLGHGGVSRAIRDAQEEPVLVSKENRPVAWIVSSDKLAEVAAAKGIDREVYERTLELIAVELYDKGTLSMGRAAKLAGLNIHDFIDLCGRMGVSVLWEPPDPRAEADALEAFLRQTEASN
jgi:predicted HTH domain antitoxin